MLVEADHPAPWIEDDGVFLCESVDLARLLRSSPRMLTNEEAAGIVGVVYVGIERTELARSTADAPSSPDASDEAQSAGVARRVWGSRRSRRSHRRSRGTA
ncbi:hypothetical protein BH09ACT12_BH09ACT12_15950 [soil metagenome]